MYLSYQLSFRALLKLPKTLVYLWPFLWLLSAVTSQAQPAEDRAAIKAMCGCFEVTFQYAETFASSPNYDFHDRYNASALEWVTLAEESPSKLVLQHILVIQDTFAMKHWRQDWLYEDPALYTFAGDRVWEYHEMADEAVQGQWTQKVYEVDDSPRYQGSATWIHVDGQDYWESTADAPLPRREYTKRSDYDVLRRLNRHQITADGHVHEQDNAKIRRRGSKGRVLVYEKGLNTYRRVDDARCQAAADWWQNHQAFWADVRAVWNEILDRRQTLQVQETVEGQRLYEVLFPLGDELVGAEGAYSSATGIARIRQAIKPFVDDSAAAAGK